MNQLYICICPHISSLLHLPYVLILYPANLLNSFISSKVLTVFWWHLEGFLYIISCHLQTETILLFFLIWLLFISFSCQIALARSFDTTLNKSGESRHHCIIYDLKGKAFSFSLLSMMLAVGLSHIVCIILKYFS